MNDSTLDILKTIIDKQMDMPHGRVFAYNGSQNLPEDGKLFIVLSVVERAPYANNSKFRATFNGMDEIQTLNVKEDILISLISKDTSARDRLFELPMALRSTFSQYQQELNKIHISTINDSRDNSFLEATARLNRFDTEISVIRAYEKITEIDYYDKFPNTEKFEPTYLID